MANRENEIAVAGLRYRLQQREISASADYTQQFATQWAQSLQPGEVVAFYGPLGSGKTTFIRGVCAGLGTLDLISSPSFALVNEYRGRYPIYHMDLYRISDPAGLKDIGWEEYFARDGICLVEWPEIVQALLPARHQAIRLSFALDLPDTEIRIIEVLQLDDSRS